VAGKSFLLVAPSGVPQDLQFTTDEQSHIRIPLDPGRLYNFPAGFSSVWLFHANSYPTGLDATFVFATGIDEIVPGGQPAYAGSGGANKWAQGTAIALGATNVGPAPAAGKRQRILSLALTVTADSSSVAGGDDTLPFQIAQGGAPTVFVRPVVFLPTVAATTGPALFTQLYSFGPTGVLGDIGARMQTSFGVAFATGGVAWEMGYTEE
jgi:hypothetical protein